MCKFIYNYLRIILYICFMLRDLNKLYVAIIENKVVCYETNLKDFHVKLATIAEGCRNYDFFYRKFRNNKNFEYVDESGKMFYLQQVI